MGSMDMPEPNCTRCQGRGVRMYGSTSTYHGGIGGAAMSYDICNACWGSGNSERPWTNILALEKALRAKAAEDCGEWFAARIGARYSSVKPWLPIIADAVMALTRKRKLPAGVDAFWFRRCAETVASALMEMAGKDGD